MHRVSEAISISKESPDAYERACQGQSPCAPHAVVSDEGE